jgi:uncharacterized protein YndB with AHSA1/START domain
MYAHVLRLPSSALSARRLTMPTTKVSRVIRAPQAAVWALLSDVEHANRWNHAWTAIEMTSGQTHGVGTRFRATMEGSEDSFEFEICDWSAPERIAFCPIRQPLEQLYSITLDSHIFQVRKISEEESEVSITARASASGLRGRLVALFFWATHQEGGLNHALDAIQRVFQPELFPDEELELLPESPAEE